MITYMVIVHGNGLIVYKKGQSRGLSPEEKEYFQDRYSVMDMLPVLRYCAQREIELRLK